MNSDDSLSMKPGASSSIATKQDKSSSEIVVVIDLGASLTKVIFQEYPDFPPQVLSINSTVADVSLESLQMNSEIGGQPEDNCWVSLPKRGNYALGYLAASKFGGNAMLRSLKFDLAIPKTAGVLWVVSQKLRKKPKILKVRLLVLLPPSEGGDSKALCDQLLEELEEFTTPTGKMRVKLLENRVMREGYGIACYRRSRLGDKEFNQHNIAVVMIGYRNMSFLCFVRGKLLEGVSSAFGMSWMVNHFVQDCAAGLSVDDPNVVEALVKAGSECEASVLSKLSRKNQPSDIADDSQRFAGVARRTRADYVKTVIRWLSQNLPSEIDEMIFCGGTARYLQSDLCQYCDSRGINIIWDGGIVIPKVLDVDGIGERLADVLGLYQYYVSKLDETKKKNGAAKLAILMQQEQKLVSPPVEPRPDSPSDHVEHEEDDDTDPLAKFDFKPAKRPDVFIKRDW